MIFLRSSKFKHVQSTGKSHISGPSGRWRTTTKAVKILSKRVIDVVLNKHKPWVYSVDDKLSAETLKRHFLCLKTEENNATFFKSRISFISLFSFPVLQ